jgi:thiol-disulfide isomerase/thioredoxin
MRVLLICTVVVALSACHPKPAKQRAATDATATAEAGPHKGVDRSNKGKPAPDVTFKDPDGGDTSLAALRGAPVLVNLWASWCAPCVKELPTLDALSRAKDGKLQIAAISQDTGPHPSVVAFLDAHKITNLEAYQDPKMALSGALGAEVLPTSILYDASGKEVWRYVGDLDWTSAAAAKLLAEGAAPQAH